MVENQTAAFGDFWVVDIPNKTVVGKMAKRNGMRCNGECKVSREFCVSLGTSRK